MLPPLLRLALAFYRLNITLPNAKYCFCSGGFAVGDPTAVWHHNVRLALATNSLCLAAAYALPPAEPFPAALNDADTIYSHLLSLGYLPENITLAGYSAGANLALSLAFRLLSQSRPLPARLALWAPWVDMTNSAPSTRLNNLCMLPTTGDGTISISLGQENTYSTFVESKTPAVSPLFYPSSAYSQLASHISIWMGIGDLDRLRDEGLLLVLRCLAADIPTRAILADESTHMLADEPETTTGRVAYDSLIAFLTTPAATSISRISYTGAPSPLSADSIRAILRASLDAYAKTVKRGKPAIRERWTDLGFRAVWDELVPWCWA